MVEPADAAGAPMVLRPRRSFPTFAAEDPAFVRAPVVLAPGGGRAYPMGRLTAVFKVDREESRARYSISEWWLEPGTRGPGPHSHAEDDAFYVLAGTMSFLVDEEWIDAGAGTFLLLPGGMTHDFENRGRQRSGFVNFSVPGGFEPAMPRISAWFRARSPEETNT